MKIVRFIFTNLFFLAIYLFIATNSLQAAESTPTRELQKILSILTPPDISVSSAKTDDIQRKYTTVRNLLTQGADPNIKYPKGYSNGIDSRTFEGDTPFLLAVGLGSITLVNIFFEPTVRVKPDFKIVSLYGTALHIAAYTRSLDYLQAIVKKNNESSAPLHVEPATPDLDGNTILHWALRDDGCTPTMINYIIELAPTMQTMRNRMGKTPLEYAIDFPLHASLLSFDEGTVQHPSNYFIDIFKSKLRFLRPDVQQQPETSNGVLATVLKHIATRREDSPKAGVTEYLVPELTFIKYLQDHHHATLEGLDLSTTRMMFRPYCGVILLMQLAFAYNTNTRDRELQALALSLLRQIIPMPGVITEDDKKYITDPAVKSDFRDSGVSHLRRLPADIQELLTHAEITFTPTAHASEPARAGAPTPRSATTPSPATAPAPAGGGKHPSDPFGLAAAAQPQDVTLQTLVKVLHVASINCTHLVRVLCGLRTH